MPVLLLCSACLLAGCSIAPAGRPMSAADRELVDRIDASLARASAYLVGRQDADGAWRSEVYGINKDGPSLTPHVISCLYFMPQALGAPERGGPAARQSFMRGAGYLVGLVGDDGNVRGDVELIYPTYTAAEASRMLAKAGGDARTARAQQAWLALMREHQLNERLGWRRSDLEYGGWSFAPKPPRRPARQPSGHGTPAVPGGDAVASPDEQPLRGAWDWSNLSATLYGIATCRSSKVPPDDPVFEQALVFVKRCQNFNDSGPQGPLDDGGFFFSPAEPIQNKAGPADGVGSNQMRFRSYGSMTVDGLRALLACGLEKDHPRVVAARKWLEQNYNVEHNPGRFTEPNEPIRDAFYYYYCWGLAHALMHLNSAYVDTPRGQADWASDLARAVLRRQQADGAWKNRLTEAREDDPLVATPFAAATLAICRHVLTGSGNATGVCPVTAGKS